MCVTRRATGDLFARLYRSMETLQPKLPEDLRRMMPGLKAWCYRRTRDYHLAEDVVQETALYAVAHQEALREPERIRGWVAQIARRKLADQVRHRNVSMPLAIDPPATEPAPEEVASEGLERMALALRLRLAVRGLPPNLRRAVRLHYLKGQTLREVASRLATTVNGVKSRLYRARRILKEDLDR